MKFLPKEKRFFDLLEAQSEKVLEAADLLEELLENYERLPEIAEKAKILEDETDNIVHEIAYLRDNTFVTPIDREDIGPLAHNIDNVVDCIERAVHRMYIFKVIVPLELLREFSRIISESAKEVKQGIECLRDLKRRERELVECCIRINDLEAEADEINRRWLEKLMDEAPPNAKSVLQTIIVKEIVETLEDASDQCEDVANILETIRIRNL